MLALIAGAGKLPAILARALPEMPFVAALDGFEPDDLMPDRHFRIEHLGTVLEEFRAMGITTVCLAGRIRRPAIDPARIDAATAPLVPRLVEAIGKGDDGALRIVIGILEDAGFEVVGADTLAPSLLPQEAVHSTRQPGDADRQDAERAAAVVDALGRLDIGQSCVVSQGQVIAVEAAPGTDAMLAGLRDMGWQGGGIFYKAAKPGQDRRGDLPVIGPDTVRAVVSAGLGGIIVQEGGVMVLELDAVRRAADAGGIFLWVRRS